MIGWRFPILDGGNEQGFNNSGIETFNGSEMYDNLAREICQNSLDAKDDDVEGPVIVKFTTEDIEISSNEAVRGLLDVVGKCEEYWKGREDDKLRHFFGTVKKIEESNTVSVLRIADYNTTGLEGSKAGKNEKSPWRGLTHSDGVSYKNEDSGGSYGIGKNAPFVCSQIRTVFYNTYAKDGEKAFQGIARLMTHCNDDNEETIGTGHFFNCDEKGPIFADDNCKFRDMFKREEYGTDVIIVGFYKTGNWQDAIEKAIVKNFFLAIYEKELIVHVDNRVIDNERLQEILEKHAVTDENVRIYKELFEARALDDHIVKNGCIMEENDVELFVRVDETYDRNIVEFRNTGMVIRIRGKNVPKSYAAVMVVRGKQLNKLLKAMEPPRHDKWDPDIILSASERRTGKKYRNALIRWTNSMIDEICKSDFVAEIDPDGMSQFLPDEFDDGTKKDEKKSESVESKVKVEKVVIKNIVNTNVKTAGKSENGTPDEGNVNNATSGGENGRETTGAGTEGGGDKVGVPRGGSKTINRPAILKQRIYQVKGGSDIYKAAIMLEDDSDNVFVSVTALGDDGTREMLNIVEYKIGGVKYASNKGKIGPVSLKANTMEHIDIKLEFKEKNAAEIRCSLGRTVMVKSKLDYPHPVLMIKGDDYDKECSFSVSMEEIQEDDYNVVFSLEYILHCESLNRLIEEEKACVVVYIESPNSSFREMVSFPKNKINVSVEVSKDKVSRKITAKPYIIATENIDSFSSIQFNPDFFKNASFDIRKGDILAIERQYDIVLDNIDVFKNCASVFSVRLDEKVPRGVKINYNDDKINVMINKTDYEKYRDLREQQEFRCLLSSILIFPALVEAIEAMKREIKGGEEGIAEKRWFLAMEKQLKRKNIVLGDMMSSVQIANELLGDILKTSLMSLDNITSTMRKGEEQ